MRDSRLISCQSSTEKIVLRASRISDSMGASSGMGFGTEEEPVSVSLVKMRTRRLCGSLLAMPRSRDIVPSAFRRRAARLRFLKAGAAVHD
jgi:hypothetical protein